MVASTDAAAVFLLVHAQGLRLRPRVGATLEAESGTNDPFAVFLTLMLVELISVGGSSFAHVAMELGREAVLGAVAGIVGGRLVVLALNRVALPQGLHAPFVLTAALVIFGAAQITHASGFLAVYLAGMGMVLPLSFAGAMTPFPERAGAASALLGFVQQSVAALCGAVVGALLGHSAWPLAIAVASMGCATLLVWLCTRAIRARAAAKQFS